jgi:hypothetical protein
VRENRFEVDFAGKGLYCGLQLDHLPHGGDDQGIEPIVFQGQKPRRRNYLSEGPGRGFFGGHCPFHGQG